MIISGTGHRPNKVGGYGDDAFQRLRALAVEHLEACTPELVISGMALGWDQALAQAAVDVGIPYDAYVPCHGQPAKWPRESQDKYRRLLNECREVHITHPGPYPGAWVMQKRNEDMVDATTGHVVALWDGSDGGTANCVRYASEKGVHIVNLWERFLQLS